MEELTISDMAYRVTPLTFTSTQVSAPTGLTATAVGSGGTFAAGTYFWEVTATTALGETTVSNEASATLILNGSANLAWTLPAGVITHIKVYRGTSSGTENTLVTTLGPTATSFTDTNVGAAGTPPTSNTATIQDTVLITGAATYLGYVMAETSGTAAAFVELQDSGYNLAEIRLSSSGSETESAPNGGVPLFGKINLHIVSGVVRGTVFVGIYC